MNNDMLSPKNPQSPIGDAPHDGIRGPKGYQRQLDPTSLDGYAYYEIKDGVILLAKVIATNTASTTYAFANDTEYWKIEGDIFQPTSRSNDITIIKTHHLWADGDPSRVTGYGSSSADFTAVVDVSWQPLFVSGDYITDPNAQYGFYAKISKDPSTGTWSGNIVWFKPDSSEKNLFLDAKTYPMKKTLMESGSGHHQVHGHAVSP